MLILSNAVAVQYMSILVHGYVAYVCIISCVSIGIFKVGAAVLLSDVYDNCHLVIKNC